MNKEQYRFIDHYVEQPHYWESFNRLAETVFHINFEEWRTKGNATEYAPYSVLDGEKVVANVSANRMHLLIDGKRKEAIQLGTVMTDPDYRGQGLAGCLMKRVVTAYEGCCDFIYLFANHAVLDFYPKFGFNRVEEFQPTVTADQLRPFNGEIRKLDISRAIDLEILERLTMNRVPISPYISAVEDHSVLNFHCTYLCRDRLFYLPREDMIVVAECSENHVVLLDIISKKPFSTERVIGYFADGKRAEIRFGFIPNLDDSYHLKYTPSTEDVLFMRPAFDDGKRVLFPALSHT